MNNYNSYVDAINKIFEYLELMKKELDDQNNLNYIESIEEYKDAIISNADLLKGKGQKNLVSFYFYHPETGEKLDSENICKDEEIVIKQNIISQLNNSDSSLDIESAIYLTRQNIDIFNLSNELNCLNNIICVDIS